MSFRSLIFGISLCSLVFVFGLSVSVQAQTPEKTGPELQVNTYTTNNQEYPSVAGLSNGGFVVTWDSYVQDGSSYGIYGQVFDNFGNTVGSEFQVNTYTTQSQWMPSVAALSGGGFVVTWESDGQDGNQTGIYGQMFDNSGSQVGSEFQVNTYTTSPQLRPSAAALSGGGFVVTWQSNGQDGSVYGVYGQVFDNSGNTVGSEFQVNTYTTDYQENPSVAALSSGGFVVTWDSEGQDGSEDGVYGQVFDNSGNTVGSEFQVNTYTTESQWMPSVAALSGGGFVVAWTSEQDGSSWGVYGQVFDNSGSQVGSEFQVNTYTNSTQTYSSVTALSGGGFVVTWESHQDGGDSYGVYGQLFNSAANRIGDEFQVNTYTTGDQEHPSVAALFLGGFVVAWESYLQDGSNDGVFGQVFLQPIGGDELAVDFGASGLWHYGSSWDRLSSLDCEGMTAWHNGLAVDFGTGLFNYNGTSWERLSSWNAEDMVKWAGGLAVDFGTGRGLFTYNGTSWKKLSSWDCEDMEAWGTSLAVDFGTGKGIFSYDGSWKRLSTWDAEDIEAVDLVD